MAIVIGKRYKQWKEERNINLKIERERILNQKYNEKYYNTENGRKKRDEGLKRFRENRKKNSKKYLDRIMFDMGFGGSVRKIREREVSNSQN